MTRIARHTADTALRLQPVARSVGDDHAVTILARVRQAWLIGQRVDSGDVAFVAAFAEGA